MSVAPCIVHINKSENSKRNGGKILAVEPIDVSEEDLNYDDGPWFRYKNQAWLLNYGLPAEIPPAPKIKDENLNNEELIAFFAPLTEILIFGMNQDPLEALEGLLYNYQKYGEEPWQIKWWGPALADFHPWLVSQIQLIRSEFKINSNYVEKMKPVSGIYAEVFTGGYDPLHLIDHTRDRRPAYRFSGQSAKQLLSMHSEIMRELKLRKILRTNNAPVGDYAEWLIAKSFDGDLLGKSAKGVDVVTKNGMRIQVKARIVDPNDNRAIQSSAIRDWDFTHMAILLFNRSNYQIVNAYMVPTDAIRGIVKYAKHDNKHFIADVRLLKKDKNFHDWDITNKIAATQELGL